MKTRIPAHYRILVLGILLLVVAIVALAWIIGDSQQTRWIEVPVAAPGARVR